VSAVERATDVLRESFAGHHFSVMARALADAGLLVTDEDRAVLDAAKSLIEADQFGGPGEFGTALMVLTRYVARREATS